MYLRSVFTRQGSLEVLQVTGSLLLLIIVCYYIVLCLLTYCEFLRVTGLFPVSLIQLVYFVGDYRHMLSVYHISSVMASGAVGQRLTGVESVSRISYRFRGTGVAHSVEVEGVRHIHRRGAVQRE